jgi:hypothetical protein
MRYFSLLLITLFVSLSQAHAQTYAIPDCNKHKYYVLKKGDTLAVNCDTLYVYSKSAQRKQLAEEIKSDSLLQLMRESLSVKDSISQVKGSIIAHFENIVKIQNTAYDSLYKRFNQADSLVKRSAANTDKALGLITKMKLVSYTTGGIMGAVAGGIVGGRLESSEGVRFNLVGAAVGGVWGIAANYWFLNRL